MGKRVSVEEEGVDGVGDEEEAEAKAEKRVVSKGGSGFRKKGLRNAWKERENGGLGWKGMRGKALKRSVMANGGRCLCERGALRIPKKKKEQP